MSDVIRHIIVINFDHRNGCEVEFCHPPTDPTDTTALPEKWSNLPSLALPDGVHHVTNDIVYFHLPSLDDSHKQYSVVACCRKILKQDFSKSDQENQQVTRNAIYKSVCVVCTSFCYYSVRQFLGIVTDAYIAQADSGQHDILQDGMLAMNQRLRVALAGENEVYGIADVLLQTGPLFLVLFKSLLLERRILVNLAISKQLTEMLLSVLSVFPGHYPLNDELLCCASILTNSFTLIPNKNAYNSGEIAKIDSTNISPLESSGEELSLEETEENIVSQPCERSLGMEDNHMDYSLHVDNSSNHLIIFSEKNEFHPSVSIEMISNLVNSHLPGFLVGSVNQVFCGIENLCDIAFSDDGGKKMTFKIYDQSLKAALSLTKSDVRFMERIGAYISQNKGIKQSVEQSDKLERWIIGQFSVYVLGLCSVGFKNMWFRSKFYNKKFVALWKMTENYRRWSMQTHECLSYLHPGRLFVANKTGNMKDDKNTPRRIKKITNFLKRNSTI